MFVGRKEGMKTGRKERQKEGREGEQKGGLHNLPQMNKIQPKSESKSVATWEK